jgi:hypothetical protein
MPYRWGGLLEPAQCSFEDQRNAIGVREESERRSWVGFRVAQGSRFLHSTGVPPLVREGDGSIIWLRPERPARDGGCYNNGEAGARVRPVVWKAELDCELATMSQVLAELADTVAAVEADSPVESGGED